jgi:hypothetical protein
MSPPPSDTSSREVRAAGFRQRLFAKVTRRQKSRAPLIAATRLGLFSLRLNRADHVTDEFVVPL